MWGDATLALAATCLLSWIPACMCHTAPGKPELTRCRSPEKETFTCWWEPGSSGGLPTTYRLFYIKERSEKVFECPNYHRAGNNSCFFDKAHTSIWVLYNITVMASNSYGNTFSESVEVDVMDIVQPHSPENVTLTVLGTEHNPYFLVQWEAPHDTDTRSGWVTLKYEVRVKLESRRQKASEWELYSTGKQKELSIYSPQPGGRYTVQARCRLDHGLWSEWSPPILIQVPDNSLRERSVMIFMLTISAFILLMAAGILAIKRKYVKHFFLPPVPGPKIKGFDIKLLKTEMSEDIFRTLTLEGFPPTPECPDQMDFLVVVDSDEDIEQSGNDVAQESTNGDQHTSDCKGRVCCSLPTENTLKKQSDRWKRSAFVHDHKVSDRESVAGPSQTFSGIFSSLPDVQHLNHLSTHDGALQKLDQESPQIKPQKGMVRNSQTSCTSSFKQNDALFTPNGLMEYVEDMESQDCKRIPTAEEGENYSKVSGIYSDRVLVLQKDSIPIHTHKEGNCGDLNKKIRDETISQAKETQEYVGTALAIL
ncbi:prolactin receptor b isoform X1 [Electrophorus electricus]|uniref:Prolactin receptor n=1 Tax=Electrophorus electricus TaxID=8005 RepID=A0A4W4H7Q9_ELEEL|nr:prolactin receptor b isoform X1 [Electrophorus electricus]XP_026858630.2 prolactin receptor b isoform X1 [Electrophorus electricus]XP_026858631.2 prolactin receptor b isoform X1 [Electrophorus electricus]